MGAKLRFSSVRFRFGSGSVPVLVLVPVPVAVPVPVLILVPVPVPFQVSVPVSALGLIPGYHVVRIPDFLDPASCFDAFLVPCNGLFVSLHAVVGLS